MALDINVNDEEVAAVGNQLRTAVDSTLVPQLTTLQSEVNLLLDDGLLLPQSSPRLKESYAAFNTNVTAAIRNITEFANQFDAIRQAVADLDSAVAGQVGGGGDKK